MRQTRFLFMILITLALVAAACGDDDSASDNGGSNSTQSQSGDSGSEDSQSGDESADGPSAEQVVAWQNDLKTVGCLAGDADGALGPQTSAAITAFQKAEGLTVDGVVGPQTETALSNAANAGETVCTSTPDAGSDSGSEAALTSAAYSNIFDIDSCSLNADLSNISMRAEADGLMLVIDAASSSGTLGVSGGTEADGITLNGDVTSVDISANRSFAVTGEFGEPNFAGEAFTLTGACPE